MLYPGIYVIMYANQAFTKQKQLWIHLFVVVTAFE